MLIDGWKNRGLTPEQVPPGEAAAFANGKGLKLYKAFQERLKILNACDFGDLLLECIRLFREQPEVLRQYQARFRFILVDEYQDTNVAQYLWLRLLAQRASAQSTSFPSPLAGEVGSERSEDRVRAAALRPSPNPHLIARCAICPLPQGEREGARQAKTSAASATTTSRSTAGAAPRSTTSCASSTIFPAPP